MPARDLELLPTTLCLFGRVDAVPDRLSILGSRSRSGKTPVTVALRLYPDDDEPPGSERLTRDMEDEFGLYDGTSSACDLFGRVNDVGLCEDCSRKLERDMIRERD